MKATEIKAKELHDKFYKIFEALVFDELPNKNAIQCAIICVEEILKNSHRKTNPIYTLPFNSDNEILLCSHNYWQEVLTILKEM